MKQLFGWIKDVAGEIYWRDILISYFLCDKNIRVTDSIYHLNNKKLQNVKTLTNWTDHNFTYLRYHIKNYKSTEHFHHVWHIEIALDRYLYQNYDLFKLRPLSCFFIFPHFVLIFRPSYVFFLHSSITPFKWNITVNRHCILWW